MCAIFRVLSCTLYRRTQYIDIARKMRPCYAPVLYSLCLISHRRFLCAGRLLLDDVDAAAADAASDAAVAAAGGSEKLVFRGAPPPSSSLRICVRRARELLLSMPWYSLLSPHAYGMSVRTPHPTV